MSVDDEIESEKDEDLRIRLERTEIEENKKVLEAEKILLETLKGESYDCAKTISENNHPEVLFGATEAISRLIRRNLRKNNPEQKKVLYGYDGSIYLGENLVISNSALALEVARFTDLWTNEEVEDEYLQPSPEAIELVNWVPLALEYQPFLLRHFKAIEKSDLGMYLKEVPVGERIDDDKLRLEQKV